VIGSAFDFDNLMPSGDNMHFGVLSLDVTEGGLILKPG
jgi:hypothetical protein